MTVLGALDLLGTFFFGLSGAMLAVRKNMDMLGVLVLACVTAFGGGEIPLILKPEIYATGQPRRRDRLPEVSSGGPR